MPTMRSSSVIGSNADAWSAVPWQLWIAVLMLALEGVSNLLLVLAGSIAAACWLAAKIVFTLGFFYRWKAVYVIFLFVGMLHVFAFASQAPVVAILNLVLVLLVASTLRYFFPLAQSEPEATGEQPTLIDWTNKVSESE